MWTVAGVLLGFVVLASLVGFHIGPHGHLAAGVVGVGAAAWLLLMAATGQAEPLLWLAFGADLTLTAGVGTAAWKGLQAERIADHLHLLGKVIGQSGVAISDLDPDGVVRIHGETWSAISLNGRIETGTTIQVIESNGVRLGVWGEQVDKGAPTAAPFGLQTGEPDGEEPEARRTGTT